MIDFATIQSRHDCREVAARLGLRVHGKGKQVTIRCPAPEHSDSSPSTSVSQVKWYCHGCQRCGDVVDLVMVAQGLERDDAIAWLGEGRELPPVDLTPLRYPPARELEQLDDALGPVDATAAGLYLESRGLDPVALDDACMAFTMASGAIVPEWAEKWGESVICWLYDSSGAPRSALTRSTWRGARIKSRTPKGHRAKGLALLCPVAVKWLRQGEQPGRIIVAEGEIDWMTAKRFARATDAVIGMRNGTWTDDWSRVMRRGQTWVIATDNDHEKPPEERSGERYAQQLGRRLRARGARVLRYMPTEGS